MTVTSVTAARRRLSVVDSRAGAGHVKAKVAYEVSVEDASTASAQAAVTKLKAQLSSSATTRELASASATIVSSAAFKQQVAKSKGFGDGSAASGSQIGKTSATDDLKAHSARVDSQQGKSTAVVILWRARRRL